MPTAIDKNSSAFIFTSTNEANEFKKKLAHLNIPLALLCCQQHWHAYCLYVMRTKTVHITRVVFSFENLETELRKLQ